MSEWQNLGEHTVYENRWVRVNMADVALPDGRHLDHTVIRLRPVAVATVVNDRNEVLLLWRHRFITGAWGWELPSGGTSDGEDPAAAAAREFEEETGWRPGPLRLLVSMDPMPGISTSHHHVYWSDTAEQVREIPQDEIESARREWVPLERVPELIERRLTESTSEAHMAGSEILVGLADELIAVWDGKPARGYGGTADVVASAERSGVPVHLVWPDGASRD